ncbi:MAG: ATP-binding protein [Coriobacteriales bacterium]|nr:ATP-binding protein [Coriobacteriales bacterium]
MRFFGREQELNELGKAFSSDGFEAVLLYGRRRVGKTELIRNALSLANDALVISCECKRASAAVNLRHLSARVTAALGLPADYVFASFDALLEAVFTRAKTQRLVFVIDELSFLLKEDPTVDSSISIAIDAHRHESTLKLVLSGSYVDIMVGLIDAGSPLYGRFTHIIRLLPFDYHTASLFYPDYSLSDKVLMYAVFGGMPYFNSLIDPERTAIENILDLVVRKDSILEHEISEMLLNETNKLADLNTVIELVGSGVVKYSDIVARLSQDKQARPLYALKRLTDMGILRKVEPINAKGNRKRTFYAFGDNLVHFYYRYVFRFIDERNVMDPHDFFEEFVRHDLEAVYLPSRFEEIAGEAIARLSRLHRISPPVFEVGTYSFDDARAKVNRQFDVVTRDRNGFTAYECKFSDSPVGSAVIREEEEQVRGLDIDFYRLGFVSRSGFSDDIDSQLYVLLTLAALYE